MSATFRPSKKTLEKIKATMQEKKLNKSQAINFLLEQAKSEHPKGEVVVVPSYLPQPPTPTWLKRELERFFRGEHSEIIELLLTTP